MTLGSETAALLVLTTNALSHQLSPTQYGLVSTDERNIALRQLLLTVETAAKLAETAQTEALAQYNESGTGVVHIRAETERIKVETEMMRAERETLKAEVAMAPQELARKEKVDKEVEQPVAETENLKTEEEAENVKAEVKSTVQERGIMGIDTLPVVWSGPLIRKAKRKAVKKGQPAGRTLQGTSSEQLMADLARFGDIARRTMQDIEALQLELEILRNEKLKAEADARAAVADAQRAVAETEILISTVKNVAKGVGRSMTQNERVKADSVRINKDLENLMHEMQGLTDEVGRVRCERARIMAGGE